VIRSHLDVFKRCPSRISFQRSLESLVKRHAPVEEFYPGKESRVRIGREHRCEAMHLTFGGCSNSRAKGPSDDARSGGPRPVPQSDNT
jgi:hypothetical protein